MRPEAPAVPNDHPPPFVASNGTSVDAGRIASVLNGVIALYVLAGWIFGSDAIVRVIPQSVAMSVNTALLFMVASICLWPVRGQAASTVRTVAACFLVVLPCVILFEHWIDFDLGIDLAAFQGALQGGNPRPGRTAPNALVGFLLTALFFLLLDYRRTRNSRALQAFVGFVAYGPVVIGTTALVGYLLDLDFLYRMGGFNRMAAPTAVAMTILGIGMKARARQAPWMDTIGPENSLNRILKVSATVLTLVAFVTGLTGFAVLKDRVDETKADASLQNAHYLVSVVVNTLDQRLLLAGHIADSAVLRKSLSVSGGEPMRPASRQEIRAVGESLVAGGIDEVRFLDAAGREIEAVGTRLAPSPAIAVPIDRGTTHGTLLWDDGFVLRTEEAIVNEGRRVGTVVVSQRLGAITAALNDMRLENDSTDVLLCHREAGDAACFPSRFYPNLRIPLVVDGKPNLAISRALLGKRGVMLADDARGTPVLAAYEPIGSYGMGLVVKTDRVDLYAPVVKRLNLFALSLVLLIGGGTLVLRAYVKPLTRRLVDDHRALKESERQLSVSLLSIGELNMALEARVRLRTAELNQARLQAEEANQAKSSFLATMSHEIRTPMNGVVGMIDVLEQTDLESGQVEIVKTVRESAHALLTIVDDVLDFSKIEAGQFEIDHRPMDVEAVVEGVCDTLDHVAAASGVMVMLFTDPAIPSALLGDAARLRQILMNLVGNAVKFSKESRPLGRVQVRATLVSRRVDVAEIEFSVTDNGIGMTQETQDRLFQPFTQADGGATRQYGGTGLGLSISQRLAQLMGGVITVTSELQRGSTFAVRLPLRIASDAAASSALSEERPKTSEIEGLPCLVIGGPDSPADDLMAYLAHARAAAHRVDSASDGETWFEEQPDGPCAVIVARANPAIEQTLSICRHAAARRPALRVRFVVIEHGRHRERTILSDNVRSMAGEAVHRTTFLGVVAKAERTPARVKHGAPRAMDATRQQEPVVEGQCRGRILVAEDNEINQKVIQRQLALLGFASDIASNGSQALEYLKRGTYDLLLTDLHMPSMDGYELAMKVRSAETGPQRMPIIALTANAVKGEAQRCLAVGMNDYMTKPVQLANLRTMLGEWAPATAADGTVS